MNRQDTKNAKIMEPDSELDTLANRVIGAAIEVHRLLGHGYLESVYEEALCVELRQQNIRFTKQAPIAVNYKGIKVGEGKMDLLVEDRLIVELKAVDALAPIHRAQVLSYLKATRLHLGLLINFNAPVLSGNIKRIILS